MIRATQFHYLMEIFLRIYSRIPEHMSGKITFDQYLGETYPLS
jgi:hypothetical protein